MQLPLALSGVVLIIEVIARLILHRRIGLNSVVAASRLGLCRPRSSPFLVDLPFQRFPELLLSLHSFIDVFLRLVGGDSGSLWLPSLL